MTEAPAANTKVVFYKRRWFKVLAAVVLATIAVTWGASAFWDAYWQTMARIMPGSNAKPSTSMEPYELVLKSRFKGIKLLPENALPLEWRLQVPRAFLFSENGEPDDVYGWSAKCCDHFIHLEMALDPASQTLKPATLVSPNDGRHEVLGIHLSNIGGWPEITDADHCVPGDQFKEFMAKRGNTLDWRRECLAANQRCRIYTYLDGWAVEYSVPRNLYAEPRKVCDIARRFLDEHTVKRDVRN